MSRNKRERRGSPRRKVDLPAGLKISTGGKGEPRRTYAAKLVDVNETGVGVEMAIPLGEGSLVSLEGEFSSSDLSLNIKGRARVVYCHSEDHGKFRAGLAYEEVALRKSA